MSILEIIIKDTNIYIYITKRTSHLKNLRGILQNMTNLRTNLRTKCFRRSLEQATMEQKMIFQTGFDSVLLYIQSPNIEIAS